MTTPDQQNNTHSMATDDFTRKAVEASIKIGLMFLLLSWCFHIANPFINPLVWGIIIAVALYPLHQKLSIILGNREKLSASLLTAVLLFIILGPCGFLANIVIDNVQELTEKLHNDSLSIPMPSEKVAGWPLIGKPIFNIWQLAASNFDEAAKTYAAQLKVASKWLLASSASTLLAVLEMLLSVIICGMLLVNGIGGHRLALSIGKRIAGHQGEELADLCIATIRGVARGVFGGCRFLCCWSSGSGSIDDLMFAYRYYSITHFYPDRAEHHLCVFNTRYLVCNRVHDLDDRGRLDR